MGGHTGATVPAKVAPNVDPTKCGGGGTGGQCSGHGLCKLSAHASGDPMDMSMMMCYACECTFMLLFLNRV